MKSNGQIKTLSPAKINLFLHITGKRSDGYHELLTLICRVSLFDTVSLTFGAKKTTVFCTDSNVPNDETNLAYRAADIFLKSLNKNKGVKICIDKKIPVSAGLGGGSSNAASVLLELNRYYGNPFSVDVLMSMGLSIGADVPFFIFRKPAIASGIGEKLKAYDRLQPLKVLLIYPNYSVSTAQVYKNLNLGLTKCTKNFNDSIFKYSSFDANLHLCNDLEDVTTLMHPDIINIKEVLLRYGATGALMSGSGPTVFGLFHDSDNAQAAFRSLLQNNNWRLFLADMLTL